jgi:hypothetical protein
MPLEPIRLRLVKTHDSETICDQDGRPVADVVAYRYGCPDPGGPGVLIVKVYQDQVNWDRNLGRQLVTDTKMDVIA